MRRRILLMLIFFVFVLTGCSNPNLTLEDYSAAFEAEGYELDTESSLIYPMALAMGAIDLYSSEGERVIVYQYKEKKFIDMYLEESPFVDPNKVTIRGLFLLNSENPDVIEIFNNVN